MTHRPNAITHTQGYTVLPGVVRHTGTFIIFGLFTTPNLCPPDTKSWRRHWGPPCCVVRLVRSWHVVCRSTNKIGRNPPTAVSVNLHMCRKQSVSQQRITRPLGDHQQTNDEDV